MAIPITNANWTTSLAAKISSSASSFTLNRSDDSDGTTLSGTYYLTFDEGTANEEHMIVSLSGSAGTVTTRGLSRVSANANVAANQFAHDRGSSVKMTDIAIVKIIRRLNGTEAFDSVDLTGVNSVAGLATPTSGETTKAANVAYANALAIAGAPDSSETVKGIVESATQAEVNAGDNTGSTTAPTVVRPAQLADVIQAGRYLFAADAEASDTYTITLTPAITAYTTGMVVNLTVNTANTAAATLNVNVLGAKDIQKFANGALTALETGDLIAGQAIQLIYDGTRFILQTPSATSLTTAVASEVQTFFGATDMTGAEAEQLTDGSAAVGKHYHGFTVGQGSRTSAQGAGAQNVAHGLGVTPKLFILRATQVGIGNSKGHAVSFGSATSTADESCTVRRYYDNASEVAEQFSTKIYDSKNQLASDLASATVTTFDATNVTLTWAQGAGGWGGTVFFQWEAYA